MAVKGAFISVRGSVWRARSARLTVHFVALLTDTLTRIPLIARLNRPSVCVRARGPMRNPTGKPEAPFFLYFSGFFSGRGAGIRTLDPLIKSQLLYQLSYTPTMSQTKFGASEGSRTLDNHLGKVALYQLSYARFENAAHDTIRVGRAQLEK